MPRVVIPQRDFVALKGILLKLLDLSEFCWRNERTIGDSQISSAAITTYELLQNSRSKVDRAAFLRKTRAAAPYFAIQSDPSIYLPPLDDDPAFVPVLTMELDSSVPKVAFRVDLYHYDSATGKMNYIGFRYETPTHGSTKHSFYHVQPIEVDISVVMKAHGQPTNVPGTIPCLPVVVDNPVALLLIVVLSLYGRDIYLSMISDIEVAGVDRKCIDDAFRDGASWGPIWT